MEADNGSNCELKGRKRSAQHESMPYEQTKKLIHGLDMSMSSGDDCDEEMPTELHESHEDCTSTLSNTNNNLASSILFKMDNNLASFNFGEHICLVKTADAAPTSIIRHDSLVSSLKLWPALKFKSWKELKEQIEKIDDVSLTEYAKAILVLEARRIKKEPIEFANGRFIAYLLGKGKLSLVILPNIGDDSKNMNLFNFNDSYEEMKRAEGEHCGSKEFQAAFAKAHSRMKAYIDKYQSKVDCHLRGGVETESARGAEGKLSAAQLPIHPTKQTDSECQKPKGERLESLKIPSDMPTTNKEDKQVRAVIAGYKVPYSPIIRLSNSSARRNNLVTRAEDDVDDVACCGVPECANSDTDEACGVEESFSVLQSKFPPPQPDKLTKKHRKRKRNRKSQGGRTSFAKAKRKEGGASLVRNKTAVEQSFPNNRTCLLDAVAALLPAKIREHVCLDMVEYMPAEGNTTIEQISVALDKYGVSLESVTNKYQKNGGFPFHLLQEKDCKLIVRLRLVDLNGEAMFHFVAWNGKLIIDHPQCSKVNDNTDRMDQEKSNLAFGKLFKKTKFLSWQITSVYQVKYT